uniref:Uncharacterized protein LOC104226549 isoform X1 n=1 Tax=Nicotiana sylvestris TaxID=4096 RepID=A0A1U7WA57_NICSY|nr:PREDICTED: uncharacterized protein LOC104226549 isoform X1 [Nicotiana sylvestris]
MAETEPQASETVAQNEKEKTSAHKMDVEAQAADDAAENGGSKSLRDEGDELGLMETPRRSRKSTTPWKKKRKMGRIRLAWVRRVSGRLWRCLITSTNSFVPGLSISISTSMSTCCYLAYLRRAIQNQRRRLVQEFALSKSDFIHSSKVAASLLLGRMILWMILALESV